MNDNAMLAACPEYLSIGMMLKATPVEEGGQRFVYIEASNEVVDQQNEIVMQQALADSADYFLRYGNLDIDHFTLAGAKMGIPDYPFYEIGRPVDVKFDGKATMVKGQIYAGEGEAAARANQFWSSLTEISPPARWYPSVGGTVQEKAVEVDPETKGRRTVIKKVRWTNIGFSKTPVNQTVPTVATVPFGVLAKCWGASGLDFSKAITAGYGTDAATLSGGAALRTQSLYGSTGGTDPHPVVKQFANYFEFRNKLAEHVRLHLAGENPGVRDLVDHCCKQFGMSRDAASEWVGRFVHDLKTSLKRRT